MPTQPPIQLSPEQQKITDLHQGHHLVLAPPGSGKTELLSKRVQQALANNIPAEKMICLTFTNRAARGMKERVQGTDGKTEIIIGNIHDYCSRFLAQNNLLNAFTALMDEEDSQNLIQEAKTLQQFTGKGSPFDMLKLNTYIKQQKLGFPKEVLLAPKPEVANSEAMAVCQRYEALKKEYALIDFDDLLTLAFYHLQEAGTAYELRNFSWLQVDEVQDLNPLQWAIIKAISEEGAHQVFFGDYEQAIFSFMGANPNGLKQITETCAVHYLLKNYRMPAYLLEVCTVFAEAHLSPTWTQKPVAHKQETKKKGNLVIRHLQGTNEQEAQYIVTRIIPYYNQHEKKQLAILVRTNKTADLYSKLLSRAGVEHFKISGFDLFKRKLVKDVFAFLNSLENERIKVAWYRLFEIFGKVPSLKVARTFVNNIFDAGLLPTDFLRADPKPKTVLSDYLTTYQQERMVVFDTEATGLDTSADDIIQIAAIAINKGVIEATFEVYLHTDKSVAASEKVHHISKAHLAEHGITPKKGLEQFVEFVGDSTLVAHNLPYDWQILQSNLAKNGLPKLDEATQKRFDTLDIARRLYPRATSHKLGDLLVQLELEGENSHNALDDVRATVNLIHRQAKDIPAVMEKQVIFLKENDSLLTRFHANLAPIWHKWNSLKSVETTFSELIADYISYVEKGKFSSISNSDKLHLNKFLEHTNLHCGTQKLATLLHDYVPEYRLYKESDLVTGEEKVIVSTIHKAKGLEFHTVIIPDCVQDVYPSWGSRTQAARTEDARTLYVGMSRALESLIFTSHTVSVNNFGQFDRSVSPFLECVSGLFAVK